ncbi:MAG: response regulator transcription factor [Lachnospiraceae bacterium]|nr:response regulator transcription factor [Lachnospiraceae bacterium]
MAKILVVEDNEDYRELLQNFLESAGYEVLTAEDGARAVALAGVESFDLLLLDLMLPKMDGYEVCGHIRQNSDVPIIMLTALDSEVHQMKGYDLRIDDYVTKPVSMPLLMRKVEAVLRRAKPDEVQALQFQSIALDLSTHTVRVAGEEVEFTLREFEILHELMKKPGEVVTRVTLVNRLWGYDFYGDTRIVDTHMKNIRRKLGACDCVETVRGIGYKLRKEAL